MSVHPRFSIAAILIFMMAAAASADPPCVNKFLKRSEGPKQIVTLLTGKLTYQEANALAQGISSHQSPPLEWVDDKGKTLARQIGDVKVVRPMPVACDGKPSGVVLQVTFMSAAPPVKKMMVKFDANMTVTLDEQTE